MNTKTRRLSILSKKWPVIPCDAGIVTMGADPELFLKKNGKVIPSSMVIPNNGLLDSGKVIRDGVQVELNPDPSTCRQLGQRNLSALFTRLNIEARKKGVEISFDNTVSLTKEELKKLPREARQFGCKPSFNVYGEAPLVLDGSTYPSRSGGGHIHLGVDEGDDGCYCETKDLDWHGVDAVCDYCAEEEQRNKLKAALKDPQRLVPVLDLLLANTFVMIDRDEGNIIRRTTYGKAGEFRTPEYGIEYRTLSNFWLRSPLLQSLAYGLARQAVYLVAYSTSKNDYASHLMSLVDVDDVRKAINLNDAVLARRNFDKIKDFVASIFTNNDQCSLTKTYKKNFDKFLSVPIETWITASPLDMWMKSLGPKGEQFFNSGFEYFLSNYVSKARLKAKK